MATATEEHSLQAEKERAEPAEKEAPQKQRPVYFNEAVSSVQGFKNFLRYKVSMDQLYGTVYLLSMGYSDVHGLISSWKRQGVKEGANSSKLSAMQNSKNWEGTIGACIGLAFKFWSLLSSRGAIPPDGNSVMERIVDAVKHPERSQQHFYYLLNTITNIFYEVGNIKYGFTKKALPEEKRAKQMQAVLTPLAIGLGLTDLFEDKEKRSVNKAKADEVKEQDLKVFGTSQSKVMQSKWLLYPVQVIRNVWRNNPKRIISIIVGVIFPLIQLQEGVDKRLAMQKRFDDALKAGSEDWLNAQKELKDKGKTASEDEVRLVIQQRKPKMMEESNSLIKKALSTVLISMIGAFYALDQLYKGEKVKVEQRERGTPYQTVGRERKTASEGISR